MKRTHLSAVVVSALVAACGEGTPEPGSVGRQLDIRVAPLSLPGLVDACYGLEVLNEELQPVWSQPSVCADRYGDLKSDITYIGTCDASDPNDDGVAEATVVLTIAGLYGPDTALDVDTNPDLLTGFRNPCSAPYSPGGCRIKTRCRENADVLVEFNLTVMRDANQGFFDIAVNFEDIFCSAKVDCTYPATSTTPERPIELVFDPATGKRVRTVVWAFACTDGDPGGPTASSTHLYMDDVVLRCGANTYAVSPSAGPGNVYPGGVGAPAPLVQAMVFEGDERVTNGGLDADKLYWNVALGLKASFFAPASPAVAPDCVLETKATATRGPLTEGTTAFNTNYPYVRVSVPINTGSVFTCSQHGLDEVAPHAGVKTWYTGPKPDGTGFATAAFGNVGAPTAGGITTNPVNALVDECLGSPSPCAANASCQDLPAGFACTCNAGYSGNGLTCTDTNGCLAAPCFAGVTCTDVAAPADGRICGACPDGMTGDGVTCVELDACVDHPCGADGDCVDVVGAGNDLTGRTCFCDDGYAEDSAGLCVDIDECEEVDACPHTSACVNEIGGFSCECLEGTVEVDGACVSVLAGYAYIPAGTCEMGSPTDEVGRYSNETQHPVTLTRAFWMKQTEVTQGEWVTLMGANPSGFASETETDRPLERMSWFSAIEYANRLSQASGLTACYVLNAPCTGTAADGTLSCQGATFLGLACKGFRLPTEAEWEYAARAGTTGPRYGVLDAIAWYLPNSGPPTHPVARKAPNAWGLHDMLGNVWEFTADWYGDYSVAVTDPTGPVSGTHRVYRGGGYGTVTDDVRAAVRGQHTSSERDDGVGFRLVRTVGCPVGTVLDDEGGCVSILAGYSYIPNGTFVMGSPTGEVGRGSDETQHAVTLTRAFWMKQTEVTQGEWVTLMGANPSGFASETETDRPLERMSWFSAIEYANRLSQASGLTACYALNAPCTGTAAEGTLSCHGATFMGLACKGFRLPTEAEWEYGARAGSTGPRYGVLDAIAWYLSNSGPPTHPVAQKAPNAWGLHDMLGNVWEFTADWYGDYAGAVTDPTGPVSGTHRVYRGGGYGTVTDDVRAAIRGQHTASERDDGVGFRLVRTVGCPVGSELNDQGGCDPIVAEPANWGYIPTNVEPAIGIVAIAAGESHTVVLRGDGAVVLWGSNSSQVKVPSGLTNVVGIAAGHHHTVALKGDGSVVAWGHNAEGQTMVPGGLTGVVAVAAGRSHTLALKDDGSVVAWGQDFEGQSTVPADLTNVREIAAGRFHSVALKADGTVVAWGRDVEGQTTAPDGLTDVVDIAAGWTHTVSLRADGSVVAWGNNSNGQTTVPGGLTNVVDIAAGGTHTVALKGDGSVVAWGDNGNGQTSVPVGLTGVVAIAAGWKHTVALKADGSVVAWGSNYRGQATVPVALIGVVAIAAGWTHTVALKNDGSVITWGSNDFGEATVPSGLTNVVAIAAGYYHSIALKYDGSVVAWGLNSLGQTTVPSGLSNVVAIAAGESHSVALKGDGSVVTWGRNNHNQQTVPSGLSNVVAIAAGQSHTVALKGDGLIVAWPPGGDESRVPSDLTNVVSVAAGGIHTVALKGDGTVVAFGYDSHGQTMVPAGLSNVIAIAAGRSHTVALKADGSIIAWGDGIEGQTTLQNGLTNVVAVAAGAFSTHALTRVQYAARPTISQVGSGAVGDTVTMIGTHFERVVAVRLAGRITRWTVDSPTQIRFIVPYLATPGPIEVVTMSGSTISDDDFDLVEVDACLTSPCGAHADCEDLPDPAGSGPDGRDCTCRPGFEEDGPSQCASSVTRLQSDAIALASTLTTLVTDVGCSQAAGKYLLGTGCGVGLTSAHIHGMSSVAGGIQRGRCNVRNARNVDVGFSAWVRCSNLPVTTETVLAPSMTGGNATREVTATCADGRHAVAGNVDSIADGVHLYSTARVGTNQWRARFIDTRAAGSAPVSPSVGVRCVAAEVFDGAAGTASSTGGATMDGSSTCPVGSVTVGGSCDARDANVRLEWVDGGTCVFRDYRAGGSPSISLVATSHCIQ